MAQVGRMVTRALRLLRVVDATEAPEAEDMQSGIDALNAMMARLEADGLSLGWAPVEGPADELPAPAEAEEAIRFNLAIVLRGEYGLPLDPDIYQRAEEGLAALRRDVLIANPLHLRTRLPCSGRYNIRTDEYDTH